MKFYEVQKALEEGKKIKSEKYGTFFLKDDYLYYEKSFGLAELVQGMASFVMLADDWEILEDIPEVKVLLQYTFFCPSCQTHRVLQQLKEPPSQGIEFHCGDCGQKVKVKNNRLPKDYGLLEPNDLIPTKRGVGRR